MNRVKSLPISVFYTGASILFGALAAALIALPLAIWKENSTYPLISAIFGALIGYKNRANRLFFYLSIVTILVLTSLISTQH